MLPNELLGTARVPGHGGLLQLFRHDGAFSLRIDRHELMTSRAHGSEEVLAEVALARLAEGSALRVLVGGLGMGFTLARALALLPPTAAIVVAELVPEVVAWHRQWLAALCGRPLDDARVQLHQGDVHELIEAPGPGFDAILLDVDNGPEGLTSAANERLYGAASLQRLARALRPAGVLAVWSSAPHPQFAARLRSAGFVTDEVRTKARRTRGPVRVVFVAQRRP